MVVGDQKKYLTCLITLKCKVDLNGMPTNLLDETAINWCKSICFESILTIEEFQQNNKLKAQYIYYDSKFLGPEYVQNIFSRSLRKISHQSKMRQTKCLIFNL